METNRKRRGTKVNCSWSSKRVRGGEGGRLKRLIIVFIKWNKGYMKNLGRKSPWELKENCLKKKRKNFFKNLNSVDSFNTVKTTAKDTVGDCTCDRGKHSGGDEGHVGVFPSKEPSVKFRGEETVSTDRILESVAGRKRACLPTERELFWPVDFRANTTG